MQQTFLTHLVSKTTKEKASLEVLMVKRGRLVGDVVAQGCLGLLDHKMSFPFSGKEGERSAELPLGPLEGRVWLV